MYPDSFETNVDGMSTDASLVDNRFATEPIAVVKPAEQPLSEEELYTLFEQAISDRVQAVRARLNRISEPLTHQPLTTGDGWYTGSVEVEPCTEPLRQCASVAIRSSLLSKTWERCLILANLALLLMMSGFDLMGVLVLYLR